MFDRSRLCAVLLKVLAEGSCTSLLGTACEDQGILHHLFKGCRTDVLALLQILFSSCKDPSQGISQDLMQSSRQGIFCRSPSKGSYRDLLKGSCASSHRMPEPFCQGIWCSCRALFPRDLVQVLLRELQRPSQGSYKNSKNLSQDLIQSSCQGVCTTSAMRVSTSGVMCASPWFAVCWDNLWTQ